MQSIRDKKKLLILLVSIISGLAIIVTTVLATVLPRLNSFKSSNKEGNAVTVDELWNNGQFNSGNVRTLIETLSGTSGGTIDTISSNIGSGAITAAQIRNYTTNKTAGQSVIVTFGGFEWIVVYLSKAQNNADDPSDDVAGDVIVTLWLSGEYTLDKSTFGNSSRFWGTNNPSSGVPTNMYGTSYIRARLNNGGNYINITSNSANPTSVDQIYSPLSDYKFSAFVSNGDNADGELTPYLVTPAQISWQENGQSAKTTLGFSYNCSNENWTNTKTGATDDSNFYGDYNYAGKTFSGYGNSTWKDDYLWLPSFTETGYSDSRPGMWDLSVAERSNGTGSSWSRSADDVNGLSLYLLNSSGNYRNFDDVTNSFAVRPALHLNLTSVAATLPTVGELWDSSSEQFNLDNVQSLLNVLSNNTSGSIATISQNIDSNGGAINAGTIRAYTTGKANGETVTLNLGGFKWQVVYLSKAQNDADDPSDDVAGDVIVTLWLSGDETLDTSTFGNSSSYYGTDNPSSGVPTSMYGTSYIRAKLNNDGNYINITSNSANPTSVDQTYTPDPNYKFSAFVSNGSDADGALTEYLVTPAQISWQENGQSAQAIIGLTRNLSNENWTDNKIGATTDDNFYSNNNGVYNYAGKTFSGYGNNTWKDDYLWLPSLTEVGINSSATAGMWGLNVAERSNGNIDFWSRSACGGSSTTYGVYYLYSSGVNHGYNSVNYSYAVRPALHLNLNAVYDALYSVVTINYDSSQGNVTGAGEYTTGDTATLTATPNPNYRFVSWTNSAEEILSTDPTYTFEVTDDITITANFADWLTVTADTGTVTANKYLNQQSLMANVTLMPQSGYYISEFSFDNVNFYPIEYRSAILDADFDFALSVQYTASNNSNYVTLTLNTILMSYFDSNDTINIYLHLTTTPYTDLTTGGSVNGVAVSVALQDEDSTTLAAVGEARITGYSTLDGIDSVHVSAIAYSGYKFVGWQVDGEFLTTDGSTLYTATSDIPLSLVQNKQLIAVFTSRDNSNINDDTNN